MQDFSLKKQQSVVDYDDNDYGVEKSLIVQGRLQLEPIGIIFLAFYLSLLMVQFLAMIFHRLNTVRHILAAIDLSWPKKSNRNVTNSHNDTMACGKCSNDQSDVHLTDENNLGNKTQSIDIQQTALKSNGSSNSHEFRTLNDSFRKIFDHWRLR